jgi:hypothetical protein
LKSTGVLIPISLEIAMIAPAIPTSCSNPHTLVTVRSANEMACPPQNQTETSFATEQPESMWPWLDLA